MPVSRLRLLLLLRNAPANLKGPPSIGLSVWSVIVALLGYMCTQGGLQVLHKWDAISASYACCGVFWIATGAVMIGGGLWTAISVATHRFPLFIAGWATAIAGSTVVIGALTYITPCAGPG
jgi:hypothetical protein